VSRHKIPSYRITFSQILTLTTLDPSTRALLYHPPHHSCSPSAIEITTVYFRAGYGPEDYKTPANWASRVYLERSRAIKCPTILAQLAGSKKVQQVLVKPSPVPQSILTRFLPNSSPETIAKLQSTFAAIYPLDNSPLGEKARAIATDPALACSYVLKPQREGGGNNIFGTKIPEYLRSIPEDHWGGYILMELIVSPRVQNMVVRNGEVNSGEVVGELGVYGVCLWDAKAKKSGGCGVSKNYEAGWLLRTKSRDSEEGGVAAGYGCVDSVFLVD